jgi:two-component system alkaline phosphatase synthesis response regulator PhoP
MGCGKMASAVFGVKVTSRTKSRRTQMQMQILLCESEPMIHGLVSEYLSPLGFKLILVRSEAHCLEMLEKKLPDVVILDTHMPLSNPAQTLRKIRGKGIKTPVVLVSTNYGITSQEDAIELGANGFIEKPFKLKDFLECMLNVMPN